MRAKAASISSSLPPFLVVMNPIGFCFAMNGRILTCLSFANIRHFAQLSFIIGRFWSSISGRFVNFSKRNPCRSSHVFPPSHHADGDWVSHRFHPPRHILKTRHDKTRQDKTNCRPISLPPYPQNKSKQIQALKSELMEQPGATKTLININICILITFLKRFVLFWFPFIYMSAPPNITNTFCSIYLQFHLLFLYN